MLLPILSLSPTAVGHPPTLLRWIFEHTSLGGKLSFYACYYRFFCHLYQQQWATHPPYDCYICWTFEHVSLGGKPSFCACFYHFCHLYQQQWATHTPYYAGSLSMSAWEGIKLPFCACFCHFHWQQWTTRYIASQITGRCIPTGGEAFMLWWIDSTISNAQLI